MKVRKLLQVLLAFGFVFTQAGLVQADDGSKDIVPPDAEIVEFGPHSLEASAEIGQANATSGLIPVTYLADDGTKKQGYIEATLMVNNGAQQANFGPNSLLGVATCYATLNVGNPVYRHFQGKVDYEYYYGYVWWLGDSWNSRWASSPWNVGNYGSVHTLGQQTSITVSEVQGFWTSLPPQTRYHNLDFTLTGSGGCSAVGYFS